MNNSIGQLNSLYYPFSRLLDDATLKYLLLVFDSVTFIDEAENAEWRKILLQRMSKIDSPLFSSYEKLADDYDMLSETGAVQIVNPKQLQAGHSQEVALATKADLSDSKFIEIASKPSSFGLTARPFGYYGRFPANKPTWQVFKGKIASPLLSDDAFVNDEIWASHILLPGDNNYSWTLSYEAGSAAVTNFYLEAAQELQLTPVTTSILHHELVLRKLKRVFADGEKKIDLIDDVQRKRFRAVFGHGEVLRLLGELYPTDGLNKVSFAEIVKFRKETQELRQKFIQEVDGMLRVIDSDPTSATYDKEVIEAIKSIKSDFKTLENNLVSARDKILPAFTEALLYGTAGGGALSAFISFLGGFSPSSIVAASALTVSGTFLVKAIEIWNEKRKLIRSQRSSVSYLAKISQLAKA
jgi:hypothetical protein